MVREKRLMCFNRNPPFIMIAIRKTIETKVLKCDLSLN